MDRDTIIRLAREAATEDGSVKRSDGKNIVIYAAKTSLFLERFAALVAAHEREACAKVCEAQRNAVVKSHPARIEFDPENFMVQKCAATIRARGESK